MNEFSVTLSQKKPERKQIIDDKDEGGQGWIGCESQLLRIECVISMDLGTVTADWEELTKEYKKLEVTHPQSTIYHFADHFFFQFSAQRQEVNNEYLELLESLDRLQQRCLKDISHQRYRINQINGNVKRWAFLNLKFDVDPLLSAGRFRHGENIRIFFWIWWMCCWRSFVHCEWFIVVIRLATMKRGDKTTNLNNSYLLYDFTIFFLLSLSTSRYLNDNVTTSDDKAKIAELEKNIIKRKAQLYDIERSLPQKNGMYLSVCSNTRLFARCHRLISIPFRSDSVTDYTGQCWCVNIESKSEASVQRWLWEV